MGARWRAALIALAIACVGGLLAGVAVAGSAPEPPDIGDPVVLTPDPTDATGTLPPPTTGTDDPGAEGDDADGDDGVQPVPRSPQAWGGQPPVEDDVSERDDHRDDDDGDDDGDDDWDDDGGDGDDD